MTDATTSQISADRADLGTHGRELILDARNIGVDFKVEGGIVRAVRDVSFQLHRGETGPPRHAMHYLVAGSWMPGRTIRKVGPALDLDTSFFSDLVRV